MGSYGLRHANSARPLETPEQIGCRNRSRLPPADLDPAGLTAKQLADRLLRYCSRIEERLDNDAWDVVRELCRRVKLHESLICEMLPDLRNCLTASSCLSLREHQSKSIRS